MTTKPDPASKAIDQALHILGEHFEAVQILATRTVEGNTHTACRGVGNWYSRQGLAHEFIQHEISKENAIQIADQLKATDES